MIKLYFTLQAPLSHGDPALNDDTGNFGPLRKQRVVGFGDVPILSGNAIRGVMRRLVMRHFLAAAGMTPEAYKDNPGQWDRIYGALANGGTLTGSEKSVQTQVLRDLRAACPPLSLLGAALYTQMLPGMCSVLDAYPQCAEMAEAGFTDASDARLEELYGDRHHVRHVSANVDREAAGLTPMPYTSEVIYPGTVLQGGLLFQDSATEIERDCAAYAVGQIRQLGGKSAQGFGVVTVTASDEIGDAGRYAAWVAEHAPAAREHIERVIPARAEKV